MTETVQNATPTGAPAPGWYPDPGGSGGRRWWSGQGWTETVQLPPASPQAQPPASPTPPAPVPLPAPPAPPAPVAAPAEPPPFGTPGSPFGRSAAPTHQRSGSPSTPTALVVGIGLAVLVVVAGLVLLIMKLTSGDGGTPSAGTGGPRGPAAQASAKLDAQSLATAEETIYSERQAYLPVAATTAVISLGQTVVHLSPQNSASVAVNPSGTGYCILVVSKSPTSGASSTVVYVSTDGGLEPSVVTTCPASY
jgi:Protein of unknown function (DUF2510)